MSFFSANYTTKSYKVRSISFPARSSRHLQDTLTLISKDLQNLKSWLAPSPAPPQASTISNALHVLNHLYNTIKNILVNSPQLLLQALANSQCEKWVKNMIEESMIYIDICCKARDAICEMSECTSDLQSALRRKKGNEVDIESNVESYIKLRKNMKKCMEKCLVELKQMDNKFGLLFIDQLQLQLLLREVSLTTNLIFQKLVVFLSTSIVKGRSTSKWLLVKLMSKGAENVQECNKNELEDVDIEVMKLPIQSSGLVCEDGQSVDLTLRKLERLDMSMKACEIGLGNLFKNLICMRVAYLNICSR